MENKNIYSLENLNSTLKHKQKSFFFNSYSQFLIEHFNKQQPEHVCSNARRAMGVSQFFLLFSANDEDLWICHTSRVGEAAPGGLDGLDQSKALAQLSGRDTEQANPLHQSWARATTVAKQFLGQKNCHINAKYLVKTPF